MKQLVYCAVIKQTNLNFKIKIIITINEVSCWIYVWVQYHSMAMKRECFSMMALKWSELQILNSFHIFDMIPTLFVIKNSLEYYSEWLIWFGSTNFHLAILLTSIVVGCTTLFDTMIEFVMAWKEAFIFTKWSES